MLILLDFSRSTRFAILCTLGIFVWEKPGKTHSETPRKLKSENNEKANKQVNNVVLQLPRRLIYKIRRIDSGAASHEQTAGRGARSQRGLNSNGVHLCAKSMRHVAEQLLHRSDLKISAKKSSQICYF